MIENLLFLIGIFIVSLLFLIGNFLVFLWVLSRASFWIMDIAMDNYDEEHELEPNHWRDK